MPESRKSKKSNATKSVSAKFKEAKFETELRKLILFFVFFGIFYVIAGWMLLAKMSTREIVISIITMLIIFSIALIIVFYKAFNGIVNGTFGKDMANFEKTRLRYNYAVYPVKSFVYALFCASVVDLVLWGTGIVVSHVCVDGIYLVIAVFNLLLHSPSDYVKWDSDEFAAIYSYSYFKRTRNLIYGKFKRMLHAK